MDGQLRVHQSMPADDVPAGWKRCCVGVRKVRVGGSDGLRVSADDADVCWGHKSTGLHVQRCGVGMSIHPFFGQQQILPPIDVAKIQVLPAVDGTARWFVEVRQAKRINAQATNDRGQYTHGTHHLPPLCGRRKAILTRRREGAKARRRKGIAGSAIGLHFAISRLCVNHEFRLHPALTIENRSATFNWSSFT